MKNLKTTSLIFTFCLSLLSCESDDLKTHNENLNSISSKKLFERNMDQKNQISDTGQKSIVFQGKVTSPWLTKNKNGFSNGILSVNTKSCGGFIVGLKTREQHGYGIINLSAIGEFETSRWANSNQRGFTNEALRKSQYATGIEVVEQLGYGIINLRLIYNDNSKSKWLSKNPRGDRFYKYNVPPNYFIQGIEVMEQHNYGIVDLRVFSVEKCQR